MTSLDWYTAYGFNYYCYFGSLYQWDPYYWGTDADQYDYVWFDTHYSCGGYYYGPDYFYWYDGYDYYADFYYDYVYVGYFGDAWYIWGMDGDVHLYYAFGMTLYCNEENLYVFDPSYWGHQGWNWYWLGLNYYYDGNCYGFLDDTWYDWGYDMNWYTAWGENYYCYQNNLYVWDPEWWYYTAGWTWVTADESCGYDTLPYYYAYM